MGINLGNAYVQIVPSVSGVGPAIERALNGASAGARFGEQMSAGVQAKAPAFGAATAALWGAATAVAQRGIDALMSSLGSGISRFDTMSNFPKMMQNLGVSAEESSASVAKLSERLSGLPTPLDAGTQAVARFTSKNGDVNRSTDLFLALNDAILAGGAPMELQSTAMEQLSQAYAKGKPDMVEWRAAMSAMPAQLKQVAVAMGYVDADALGEALRTGKASMDDFMAAVMRLDAEGSAGFASFAEQARNSTGGVATSIALVQTAFSRLWANVLDAVGADTIGSLMRGIVAGIDAAGRSAAAFIREAMPAIKEIGAAALPAIRTMLDGVGGALKAVGGAVTPLLRFVADNLPVVTAAVAAFMGFRLVASGVMSAQAAIAALTGTTVASAATTTTAAAAGMATSATAAQASMARMASSMRMLGAAIVVALAVAAVVAFVGELKKAGDRAESMRKATQDMSAAIRSTAPAFKEAGSAAEEAAETSYASFAKRADDIIKKHVEMKEQLSTRLDDAAFDAGRVETYRAKIEELAGHIDGDATKLAELKGAVDDFNKATGSSIQVLDEQTGRLNTGTEAVNRMAQAHIAEARSAMMKEQLTEALKQQGAELKLLEEAQARYNEVMQESYTNEELHAESLWLAAEEVARMQQAYDDASLTVGEMELAITSATMAAGSSKEQFAAWAASSETARAALDGLGADTAGLCASLAQLGLSTSDMEAIGSESFRALAQAFMDGNTDIMAAAGELGIFLPGSMGLTGELASAEFLAKLNSLGPEAKAALMAVGSDGVQGLSDGLSDAEAAELAAQGVSQDVLDKMRETFGSQSPWTTTTEMGQNGVQGLADGLAQGEPATAQASAFATSVLGSITGAFNAAATSAIGTGGVGGFAAGVGDAGALGAAGMNASALADAAKDNMRRDVNSSSTWGRDLASGLASGLRGAVSLVSEAAGAVAGAISSLLHFSRPDAGPLRDYEQWMPDMVSGLAASLRRSAPALVGEAGALAEGVAAALEPGASPLAGMAARAAGWDARPYAAGAGRAGGQAGPSFSIGSLAYTPDSRVAGIVEQLFSEVMRTQRMGVSR